MSGNGVDLGHVVAMLGTVIETQHEMQLGIRALQGDLGALRGDVRELRRDMTAVKKDLAGLRQAVTDHHASVLGHGVLISEPEERVRWIEEHRQLPPAA